MITTRTELLEQLLTEEARKALAEIDAYLKEFTLSDVEFDDDDRVVHTLDTYLTEKESYLVKEVLTKAGYNNVSIKDGYSVRFYI